MRIKGQPLCGKCTPSAFGISPCGKATHNDLRVAIAPSNHVRCHPKVGDKFLSCGEAAVHLATSHLIPHYFPLNSAFLFSRNAVMPSLKSSLPEHWARYTASSFM